MLLLIPTGWSFYIWDVEAASLSAIMAVLESDLKRKELIISCFASVCESLFTHTKIDNCIMHTIPHRKNDSSFETTQESNYGSAVQTSHAKSIGMIGNQKGQCP